MIPYYPYPYPPYRCLRRPLFAPNGVVATSQPLAAQAGLSMLLRGGNAVDAAVAAAITLTVVEPASCSMGGDVFALVWDGKMLHGLNGSGRSSAALTADLLRQRGHTEMPDNGWPSTTVPGAPAAWYDLHARFGKLPFAQLFEPAINYAERGFPVAPIAQYDWQWSLAKLPVGPEFEPCRAVFAPNGQAPQVGEHWYSEDMARSLRLVAETNTQAFYQGDLADSIVAFSRATGGFFSLDDLTQHTSAWVDPISTTYRGVKIWEIPPNGQGLAALLALNILEGFDLPSRESAESYHLQIEAMKLAYADAKRYIADPASMDISVEALLSKDYAAVRRRLIGAHALIPESGAPIQSDTAYLCTADSDVLMVSLIESTFSGFGSGIVIPGTGIVLQNRGSGFTLEPDHPNGLAPRKRPYHTIIPGFLTRQGEPIGPFGVMGGHMQPQGHVQVVVNTVDYGFDPQVALDAPRWFWWSDRYLKVEPTVDPSLVQRLSERGHEVDVDSDIDIFGRGQAIWRLPSGGYIAGSDSRADGCAIGY
ncbi:MAG TPA: gamma-glutamyltransferase family protein [Aggregatilineaceae bacterium]|nr:gamma-glutamyltransferase family protein [Aggregatilineaceae bacterium]